MGSSFMLHLKSPKFATSNSDPYSALGTTSHTKAEIKT